MLTIKVKYCGGCNPEINRVGLVESLKDRKEGPASKFCGPGFRKCRSSPISKWLQTCMFGGGRHDVRSKGTRSVSRGGDGFWKVCWRKGDTEFFGTRDKSFNWKEMKG